MTLIDVEKWAYILFCATMVFSYLGDDDVAYRCMGRMPTGKEARAQVRFAVVKVFASMSGGAVMAFFGRLYIQKIFSFYLSLEQTKLLWGLCGVVIFGLIGILQNIIRHFQGRKQRSIFETEKIRYNLKRWWGW